MARSNKAGQAYDYLRLRLNGATGSSYSRHALLGNGSSASANATANDTLIGMGEIPAATATASIFGGAVIDLLDYKDTNKNRTVRGLIGEDKNGSGTIYLASGAYYSTTAVSSLSLFCGDGGDFIQYSSFALYGINSQSLSDWFVIIDAKRSNVKDLLMLAHNVINHTIDNVRPLLVLDTANATMDIDNENDNSEVGAYIAALKQTIYIQLDTPVCIITHTNKNFPCWNLNDSTLRSAISDKGDMNVFDFKKTLKRDSRWQYTENAKQEVSDITLKILRDFGFQG